MEAELNKVRETIRHSVSLNPFGTTKQLFLHTDAAKLKGLGLVVTQPISDNPEDGQDIIWMDSTVKPGTQPSRSRSRSGPNLSL